MVLKGRGFAVPILKPSLGCRAPHARTASCAPILILAPSMPMHSWFAQTQFVLNSLAQWQFRPATQNGEKAKVEVLLIIPEME
jgi:hypothetical protein